MGTNFYARIIPKKSRKSELIKAIEKDDYQVAEYLFNASYNSDLFSILTNEGYTGSVHLGKRSGGWKFLFAANAVRVFDGHDTDIKRTPPYHLKFLYPLSRSGIAEFLKREDVIIYDEYNEEYTVEEFFDLVDKTYNEPLNDGSERYDIKIYEKEHPNERSYPFRGELDECFEDLGYEVYKGEFYSDGLRFSTTSDFS